MRKLFVFIFLFGIFISQTNAYVLSTNDKKAVSAVVNSVEKIITKKGENYRNTVLKQLIGFEKVLQTKDEKKYHIAKELIKELTEENVGDYRVPNGKLVVLYKLRDKYRYSDEGKRSGFFDTKDLMLVHLAKKYAAHQVEAEYKDYKIVKKESLFFVVDEQGSMTNQSFTAISEGKKYIDTLIQDSKTTTISSNDLKNHIVDIEYKQVYYMKNGTTKVVLPGADYTSFKEDGKNNHFGFDRNSVYYKGVKIKLTDSFSFKVLENGYIKDKSMVMYCNDTRCLEVPGADAPTFEVLSNGMGSDKNRQYNGINRVGN